MKASRAGAGGAGFAASGRVAIRRSGFGSDDTVGAGAAVAGRGSQLTGNVAASSNANPAANTISARRLSARRRDGAPPKTPYQDMPVNS
ncbi:hypothetical protein GCM10009765_11170 [Fodinicola feengrottensis]|uniref:Uncharacterized protein n=1 Tax=Fodinicola feengrottensis TaxID=435914 RepID=A0ABP4RZ91_9ACTN